ncbi:hypothetical protein ATPR_1812 [Acetobacter tropicalis NBRC 101654]|uniref:Uncharacterized protein n=1 Tax=Acetobacter tropicalis NBRC 101654 TaxID=749388 RepID=F7VEL3_9PROT|nr:hypothetical protein ATPR_1812 [Acetobacter tropicalis NBRC 101654]
MTEWADQAATEDVETAAEMAANTEMVARMADMVGMATSRVADNPARMAVWAAAAVTEPLPPQKSLPLPTGRQAFLLWSVQAKVV